MKRGIAVAVGLAALAACFVVGIWKLRPHREQHAPGVVVDESTFPNTFVEAWTLDVPEQVNGIELIPPKEAGGDREIAVLGESQIMIVGADHRVRRRFPFPGYGNCGWRHARFFAMDAGKQRSYVFAAKETNEVIAYSEMGDVRWRFATSPDDKDALVDDIAIVKKDGKPFVAVGMLGALALLDAEGQVMWRNKTSGAFWIGALDGNDDGKEDIVAKPLDDFTHDLTCYSTADAKVVKKLPANDDAHWLSVVDLDGDGDSELLALGMGINPREIHLAAWDDDAKPLYQLRIAGDENPFGVTYGFGTFRPGERGSIVMGLPSGWVVGTTSTGSKFGFRWAKKGRDDVAAPVVGVDFDKDGIDELLTGQDKRLVAYRWKP